MFCMFYHNFKNEQIKSSLVGRHLIHISSVSVNLVLFLYLIHSESEVTKMIRSDL